MNHIDKAFAFYAEHINDTKKFSVIIENGFKVTGSVSSVIWEVFCSLLVNKKSSGLNHGSDLIGWEVKSAQGAGSYEYQYHLKTGLEKLFEDCRVNHIFCNYSESYLDIDVRVIKGSDLSQDFFEKWIPDYKLNYTTDIDSSKRRQRFRRNISNGYVKNNGIQVIKIHQGKIVYRDDDIIHSIENG